jgi:hypothetical protein
MICGKMGLQRRPQRSERYVYLGTTSKDFISFITQTTARMSIMAFLGDESE